MVKKRQNVEKPLKMSENRQKCRKNGKKLSNISTKQSKNVKNVKKPPKKVKNEEKLHKNVKKL